MKNKNDYIGINITIKSLKNRDEKKENKKNITIKS